MKIIVTHSSPDLDAIASVWLIKKFLPGWADAEVKFVPSGERYGKVSEVSKVSEAMPAGRQVSKREPIEKIGEEEIVHVDTGLGPFDHHSTADENISATSLVFDYIKEAQKEKFESQNEEESKKWKDKEQALYRMVKVITDIDHFKEVFWDNPLASYHDFSLISILEGLKLQKPNEDLFYVDFIMQCLDAVLHNTENKIWAEKEISEKGIEFETKWGKGLGVETVNDSVIKIAQKMGYAVVVRKDPRKGYVRIKALPAQEKASNISEVSKVSKGKGPSIDLTLVYEKLRKMDPEATWFLHVSKKMLLNGTAKNPKMKASTLSLKEIIEVLKGV